MKHLLVLSGIFATALSLPAQDGARGMKISHVAAQGFKVPQPCPTGQLKNANFTVQEPNEYAAKFVQYRPGLPLFASG